MATTTTPASSKMARGLAAAEGIDLGTASAIARSQKACLVCGHGIVVYPWGDVVPAAERVILEGRGADGLSRSIAVHAGCLGESASVGSLLAVALGFAEPEL